MGGSSSRVPWGSSSNQWEEYKFQKWGTESNSALSRSHALSIQKNSIAVNEVSKMFAQGCSLALYSTMHRDTSRGVKKGLRSDGERNLHEAPRGKAASWQFPQRADEAWECTKPRHRLRSSEDALLAAAQGGVLHGATARHILALFMQMNSMLSCTNNHRFTPRSRIVLPSQQCCDTAPPFLVVVAIQNHTFTRPTVAVILSNRQAPPPPPFDARLRKGTVRRTSQFFKQTLLFWVHLIYNWLGFYFTRNERRWKQTHTRLSPFTPIRSVCSSETLRAFFASFVLIQKTSEFSSFAAHSYLNVLLHHIILKNTHFLKRSPFCENLCEMLYELRTVKK